MRLGVRSSGWVVVIVAAVVSWSQTSSTSLRGTISDPKGAVVPGAEVTIENSATAFSRTTKTDDHGFYQFLEVPPATYTLSVTASGFGTVRVDKVLLLVNTPATLNQVLHVQAVAEHVEVMSEAP